MSTAVDQPDLSPSSRRRSTWIWIGRLAAVGVLLLVFGAYQQPEMLMQMAQQLWSCFG